MRTIQEKPRISGFLPPFHGLRTPSFLFTFECSNRPRMPNPEGYNQWKNTGIAFTNDELKEFMRLMATEERTTLKDQLRRVSNKWPGFSIGLTKLKKLRKKLDSGTCRKNIRTSTERTQDMFEAMETDPTGRWSAKIIQHEMRIRDLPVVPRA